MSTSTLAFHMIGKQRTIRRSQLIVFAKNALFVITAFLLTRVSIPQGMLPFGFGFFISALGLGTNKLLIGSTVLCSMAFSDNIDYVFLTSVSVVVASIFYKFYFSKSVEVKTISIAILGFFSVLIPGLLNTYFEGFLMYDVVQLFFRSLLVFSLVFIFRMALITIENTSVDKFIGNEEMISIAITAILAIAGLGTVTMFDLSVRNVFCIVLTMTLSYACGSGVGTAVGITCGLMINLTSGGIMSMHIASYAICGLLGGVLRGMGKVGAGLGFIGGYAIFCMNLAGVHDVFVYFKEVALAITIFALFPENFFAIIESMISKEVRSLDKKTYSTRIREITIDRLDKFSKTFRDLSKTFKDASETLFGGAKQETENYIREVIEKICNDCSCCDTQQEKDNFIAQSVTADVVLKLEENGVVSKNDMPLEFLHKCKHINEFIHEVNHAFELLKVNILWRGKMGENRGAVSQQLEGISNVISGLAQEIGMDIRFKRDVEDKLFIDLKNRGIEVKEVIVLENRWSNFEVSILHCGCGGERVCVDDIEKSASVILGKKMVKEDMGCNRRHDKGICSIKLIEEQCFSITTGISKKAKHKYGVSGDSYTFSTNGNSKYFAALSDGMGSGESAARQSNSTIKLLEELMESGFDKDTAVKMINSILMIKSSEESFATIDLTAVDLLQGKVEFVKIGAPPTYIKRANGVETVKCASLPAGLLENIEVEPVSKNLTNGDFVIMMSDGIFDVFRNSTNESIRNYIENIDSLNPQEIADNLLEKALSLSEWEAQDDMTVICAKIWKKSGI